MEKVPLLALFSSKRGKPLSGLSAQALFDFKQGLQ